MNNNRFTELLNLYLENKVTDRERDELVRLIREGKHDQAIKERIEAMLTMEVPQDRMDTERAENTLQQILAAGEQEERIIPIRTVAEKWRWVAAAAVLVIAVSAGWWISRQRPDPLPQQWVAIEQAESPSVVHSGKQFVRLPDGSTVLLNANSRLSYPASFGTLGREVTLIGEGYFDVRHDPSKPFKVLTGDVTTTVLGTAFNVKAYPGDEEIEVTVTRGKVNVEGGRRSFGIIKEDQQIAVNTATHDFVQTNVKAATAVAWQSKYLILDDVSLEEAARIIGQKYKVEITLANEELKACRISATFLNGENLEQVLTVVCGVVHSTYDMLPDGSARIVGKGCQ